MYENQREKISFILMKQPQENVSLKSVLSFSNSLWEPPTWVSSMSMSNSNSIWSVWNCDFLRYPLGTPQALLFLCPSVHWTCHQFQQRIQIKPLDYKWWYSVSTVFFKPHDLNKRLARVDKFTNHVYKQMPDVGNLYLDVCLN